MIVRRLGKRGVWSYVTNDPTKKLAQRAAPTPPRLLPGELEDFRFDFYNARIYDGYLLYELYGAKMGIKHSPAMKAYIKKDTLVASMLLIFGSIFIERYNEMYKVAEAERQAALDTKRTRIATFAPDTPQDHLRIPLDRGLCRYFP